MAWVQPDIQHFGCEWTRNGGARFWRVGQAEQVWTLTVEPNGWLTKLQAATLLSAETVRVHEWVRDGRIENTTAPDGVVVVSMRSVAEIWKHHRAGGRGPGFAAGTFRSG